jgi:hypothetical protein
LEDGLDRIDLSEWQIASLKELRDVASSTKSGVMFELSKTDTLTVQGLTLESLSVSDVLFADG